MKLTRDTITQEHEWTRNRHPVIVPLINQVRDDLGRAFDTTVGTVTTAQYTDAVDTVFADDDIAVNLAALIVLLRDLDVEADYPGFVIDEVLGREIAGLLAGNHPYRLLAEATFHYADIHTDSPGDTAGADDLDAALAAGFQTRLPGWAWTDRPTPF